MSGLNFDGVSKIFGEVTAVDAFSLDVKPGEFVALVGPSGCGKTTSLRIMAGLEEPTSGRVSVSGRDVTNVPSRDRNLSMVFQSYALYPHMTVAENIGFSLSLRGMHRAEIEQRVKTSSGRLGIAHLLHRRPKELSGGQRQRVAVARCIVREPSAFLFDEPLSNLDAKLRGAARVEIAKLQKSLDVTTLYVTHDQIEAMTMADRIVLMDNGRVRQQGAPMDLYKRPRDLFVASFLGSPPMNLIAGRVVRTHGSAQFIAEGFELSLPNGFIDYEGACTLGIRPEALSPDPNHGIILQGVTSHLEYLGAETLLEFILEGASAIRLVARLTGSHPASPGDALVLSCPPSALHLFDAAGNGLLPGS